MTKAAETTDATAVKRADDARKWRRIVNVFIGLSLFGFVSLVAVVTLSIWPTNVKALSTAYPAIEDRAARVAKTGCGLDEAKGDGGACTKVVVANVREEEVKFPSSIAAKGLPELNGTLSIPEGPNGASLGPRPAIIFLHGSGPNSRDEVVPGDLVSKVDPPFAVLAALADLFARQGIVVLRWDKRGCVRCYPELGTRPEYLAKFSFTDFVTDARDALAYLATRAEVDPNALVVAGHSEGGQLAPYVANGDPRVVAVLMLSGLTETFDTALVAQFERFQDIRLGQGDLLGAVSIRGARRGYQRCFDKLAGAYDPKDECLGGGVTLAALAELIAYEKTMPAVLQAETCPLFASQGSVDRNIDPVEMGKLRGLLAGKDFELHYVPGMNHILVDVIDRTSPPALDADLARRLKTFISSVKR